MQYILTSTLTTNNPPALFRFSPKNLKHPEILRLVRIGFCLSDIDTPKVKEESESRVQGTDEISLTLFQVFQDFQVFKMIEEIRGKSVPISNLLGNDFQERFLKFIISCSVNV